MTRPCFRCARNCQDFFSSGCTILYSQLAINKGSYFFTQFPTFATVSISLFFSFLSISHVNLTISSVKWHHIDRFTSPSYRLSSQDIPRRLRGEGAVRGFCPSLTQSTEQSQFAELPSSQSQCSECKAFCGFFFSVLFCLSQYFCCSVPLK